MSVDKSNIYNEILDIEKSPEWISTDPEDIYNNKTYKDQLFEAFSLLPDVVVSTLVQAGTKIGLVKDRDVYFPYPEVGDQFTDSIHGTYYSTINRIVIRIVIADEVAGKLYYKINPITLVHEAFHAYDFNLAPKSRTNKLITLSSGGTIYGNTFMKAYTEEKNNPTILESMKRNEREFFAYILQHDYLIKNKDILKDISQSEINFSTKFLDSVPKSHKAALTLLCSTPGLNKHVEELKIQKVDRIEIDAANNKLLYYRNGHQQEVPLPPPPVGGGGTSSANWDNNKNFSSNYQSFDRGTVTYFDVEEGFNQSAPHKWVVQCVRANVKNDCFQIRWPVYNESGSGCPLHLKAEMRIQDDNYALGSTNNGWSDWFEIYNHTKLSSSSSGKVEGEIADARNGYFGKEYTTLGERLDQEFEYKNTENKNGLFVNHTATSNETKINNSIEGKSKDLSIKGNTLVNICDYTLLVDNSIVLSKCKPNTVYTVVRYFNDRKTLIRQGSSTLKGYNTDNVYTFTTNSTDNPVSIFFYNEGKPENLIKNAKCLVVEGTFVNIPKYFEGMKSLGEETSIISLLSRGKNLLNPNNITGELTNDGHCNVFGDVNLSPSINIELNPGTYFLGCYDVIDTNGNGVDPLFDIVSSSGFTVHKQKNLWCETFKESITTSVKIDSSDTYSIKLWSFLNKNFGFKKMSVSTEQSKKDNFQPYIEAITEIPIPISGGLKGVNGSFDEILTDGTFIQRVGERPYVEGDELNTSFITDTKKTYFALDLAITHSPNDSLKYAIPTFSGYTVVSCTNIIHPSEISAKFPVELSGTLSCLKEDDKEIKNIISDENIIMNDKIESNKISTEDKVMTLIKVDFDVDFRLMEVEMILDIPLNIKGVNNMAARTPFEMAEIIILGGDYDRADMEYKIGKYLERGRMTKEEHDKLIALMDAQNLTTRTTK